MAGVCACGRDVEQLVQPELLQIREDFGVSFQLDGGALLPGHQPPGAEEGQDIQGGDVDKAQEQGVAVGVEGTSGVDGGNGLVDGGVARESDYWHVKSPSGPLKSISKALLNTVREKSCENWKRD